MNSPLGAASTKNELEEKEESAKKAVVEEASREREEGRTILVQERSRRERKKESRVEGRGSGKERGGKERVGDWRKQRRG